ncbi:MAG: lysophospholipid acyltransferase family protein [Cellvibrionales bacterium]|nr:lysophospholipid acyltransferase family protein [Cellvibrionales bacterium]
MPAMNQQKRQLKDYPVFFGLFLIKCLVQLPLPVWQRVGIELGKIIHKFAHKRRRITEINLTMAFPDMPESERNKMVRDVFINTTLGALESFYGWWASSEEIQKRSEVKNLETLQNLNKDAGVIIIGAHFTTLDLSGRVMGERQKVDIVYKSQKNKAFNDTMIKCRAPHYGEMISKKDMRTMIKRLKAKNIVWYAPDQDFGPKGSVFAPFFGVPTATLSNIAKLVKLTGAKVVFFSHFREGLGEDTRYIGEVTTPFADQHSESNVSDDDAINAQIMNAELERSLKDNDVKQYFWVHKRFKTRPNGEPNPYK